MYNRAHRPIGHMGRSQYGDSSHLTQHYTAKHCTHAQLSTSGSGRLPLQAFDSPAVRVYATIRPLMHQALPRFSTHRDRSAVKTGESQRPAKPGVHSNSPAYSRIHLLWAVADGVNADESSHSAHPGPTPK